MKETRRRLLTAEKEALILEPIPQRGKFTHTARQVYVDTTWGAARRAYIELRLQAIVEELAEPVEERSVGASMKVHPQPIVDAAQRLTALLSDAQPGLYTWNLLCEHTFQELVKAAAEESYIVKAARLLTNDLCDHGDAQLRANAMLLVGEIARAGRAPYDTNPGDSDAWVEPLRAELHKRNP